LASRAFWQGGSPTAIADEYERRWDQVKSTLAEEMQRIVDEAEDQMHQIVDSSITPWGEYRVSQGRQSAGRIETGDMDSAISSNVEIDGNLIRGEWGWLNDVEIYYVAQEHGTDHIDAMNSLLTTYVAAVEKVASLLEEVAR